MGRMYSISRSGTTTTSCDIWRITAPSTAVVRLHSAFFGQSSDFGDAAAEMLRIQIFRPGSIGATFLSNQSARSNELGDSSFGGTNSFSSVLSTGNTLLIEETFNIQAGWYYTPTPEERITVSPGGKLSIALPAAPADGLTTSFRATFEEIGT